MKYFIIILLFLNGCWFTPKSDYIIINGNETINCEQVPKIWWGNRGEDPSENSLWRCFDWELRVK